MPMNKKEAKLKAQDIIMHCVSLAGYQLDDLSDTEAEAVRKELKPQMDRIAKMFGYEESWFS